MYRGTGKIASLYIRVDCYKRIPDISMYQGTGKIALLYRGIIINKSLIKAMYVACSIHWI